MLRLVRAQLGWPRWPWPREQFAAYPLEIQGAKQPLPPEGGHALPSRQDPRMGEEAKAAATPVAQEQLAGLGHKGADAGVTIDRAPWAQAQSKTTLAPRRKLRAEPVGVWALRTARLLPTYCSVQRLHVDSSHGPGAIHCICLGRHVATTLEP